MKLILNQLFCNQSPCRTFQSRLLIYPCHSRCAQIKSTCCFPCFLIPPSGRGANDWLTVPGQAAFTFHLTLHRPAQQDRTSFMQTVTCMQHLVALSILLTGKRLLARHLHLLEPCCVGDGGWSQVNEEAVLVICGRFVCVCV